MLFSASIRNVVIMLLSSGECPLVDDIHASERQHKQVISSETTVRSISPEAHGGGESGLDLSQMHQRTIRRSASTRTCAGGLEGRRMKLDVYENLLQINAGFDQAIRSIA